MQKTFYQIMKITNFRGELTDITAKKEALQNIIDDMELLRATFCFRCFTGALMNHTKTVFLSDLPTYLNMFEKTKRASHV